MYETFLVQNEEVLATASYYRQRSNTFHERGGRNQKGKNYFKQNKDKSGRSINPKGKDGNLMVCNACGSFRHLVKECPYSYEKNKGVHAVEEVLEQEDIESVNLTAEIEEKLKKNSRLKDLYFSLLIRSSKLCRA